jgi:hypothetical protein
MHMSTVSESLRTSVSYRGQRRMNHVVITGGDSSTAERYGALSKLDTLTSYGESGINQLLDQLSFILQH